MDDPPVVAALKGVTAGYGGHIALRDVSLEIFRGEVLGLLGHNGAGKTTMIRVLNGVLAPMAGRARVFGSDPVADGSKVRGRTAVVLQDAGVDDRQTARAHLRFFARLYGLASGDRRIDDLLQLFDLDDRADDRVGGYSHGMRRRLALCRALLHDPALLYLDEPTSGLDPVSTRQLRELIGGLRRDGHTIVLASHDLSEVEQLCDRVAILREGGLVALDTPRALADQYSRELEVRLEVDPEADAAAARTLEGVPEVTGIRIIEPGVLGCRVSERAAMTAVLRRLLDHEVPVFGLRVERVDLETVYLRTHGLRGEADAESRPRDGARQA
ncbi:ABC transporter ATP-binding protein [Actinomadura fulvescens]|uniref:ABC transporter ATP-binding protein n=1 Tax=Actinomadura fulvescens TaxID=46160 RepID=A0ABP6BUU8_9ACTN